MLTAFLVVATGLMTAAPDEAAVERASVLVMNVEPKHGVPAGVAELATTLLVGELRKMRHIDVVSYREVEGAMSAEQRKMVAGCDAVSCAAEIAGALNADQIVLGSLGRLGATYVLSLSRITQRNARVVGSSTRRFEASREEMVAEQLPDAVRELFPELTAAAPAPAAGPAPTTIILQQPRREAPLGTRILVIGMRSVGGVAAFVGTVTMLGGAVALVVAAILVVPYVLAFYVRRDNGGAAALVSNAATGTMAGGVGVLLAVFSLFVLALGGALLGGSVIVSDDGATT